ncbi:helix-turn-helix domain-containing protein [Thioclava sp. BHET1]|nr:helix-turn-helix domain-containing protein [Thioclava sp. BHET1]
MAPRARSHRGKGSPSVPFHSKGERKMIPARPYTPDTLASRWECSAETVRQLVRSKQLSGFRIGRMIRIPVSAVEEFEQCASTRSDASTAAMSSHGWNMESADGFVLTHTRPRTPRGKQET